MKKKIAGIERPYSPRKLGELLCDYIVQGRFDESAKLDYFSPNDDDDTEIKEETFSIFSITDFGSNEGIYTRFYIEYFAGKRIRLMTAKTLGETKGDYVNMHVMAANICYSFNEFVSRNIERFRWYGYSVSYSVGGVEKEYCWCGGDAGLAEQANYLHEKFPNAKVYFVDMSTRKKKEYKF